ncbi:MAG: hypothetical protein AAFV53_28410 [Myxococcota bacterium]
MNQLPTSLQRNVVITAFLCFGSVAAAVTEVTMSAHTRPDPVTVVDRFCEAVEWSIAEVGLQTRISSVRCVDAPPLKKIR